MANATLVSSIGPVTNPRTEALYHAIIGRDGTACHLCGDETAPMERSADHLRPKARGGSDRLANLALSHKICNGVRGTASVEIARPVIRWFRDGWLSRAEAKDLLWRARHCAEHRRVSAETSPR